MGDRIKLLRLELVPGTGGDVVQGAVQRLEGPITWRGALERHERRDAAAQGLRFVGEHDQRAGRAVLHTPSHIEARDAKAGHPSPDDAHRHNPSSARHKPEPKPTYQSSRFLYSALYNPHSSFGVHAFGIAIC